MRSLFVAAVGLAFGLLQQAAAAPSVETVFTQRGSIAAFAQDGALATWFTPVSAGCNMIHVASLTNPAHVTLPEQRGAQNVTCRWQVTPATVRLAIAGKDGRVAWTLWQAGPIPFDYLLGASVGSRKERRFQEFAHTKRGVGLWLSGVSGDKASLVYSIAAVDYVDEAGCLTKTGTCKLKTAGGGLYRMMGRQTPRLIPGTDAAGAVELSVSDGAVAYVPSASVSGDGRPTAAAGVAMEIVDLASGAPIAHAAPQGVPLGISLSSTLLAALERMPDGLRLAWYDRATGAPEGSVSVPATTTADIAAGADAIVYRVGRSIRVVDTGTTKSRELTRAASAPVGLSLEGQRVAWAENLKGTARVRALDLTP
jgi:hypothetical protein